MTGDVKPPPPVHPAVAPAQAAFHDAHQSWHDAFEAYHQPEDFRRHVEATIQALRNVTFRLQSTKAELPQPFDTWYGAWQELMKADERMKWLNEARIEVVKRGGLGAESMAMVSVVDSYLEPGRQLLQLPAGTLTSAIVERAIKSVPAEYRPHQAIEVARRWVAAGRPDEELLGLLAHCFHVLDALLLYGNELAAGASDLEDPATYLDTVQHVPCMLFDPSMITLTFEADTGDPYLLSTKPVQAILESLPDSVKAKLKDPPPSIQNAEPLERAAEVHRLAREIFKKQGVYMATVELRRPDGEWEASLIAPRDKRDKFMVWHLLGRRVLLGRHDALIFTGEMWMAPMTPDVGPYYSAEEAKGRKEVLSTFVETADGGQSHIYSEIVRVLRRPYLKKPVTGMDLSGFGFSLPIQRAWAIRRQQTGFRESTVGDEPESDSRGSAY